MGFRVAVVLVAVLFPFIAAGEADPDTEIAKRHVQTGRAYYEQGRFDGALAEFEAAFRLRPLPDLQYNIAQCHERAGRAPEALEAFERFLDGSPDAPDAAAVRARVAELRQRIEAARPRPAPEPPAVDVPTPATAPVVAPPPASALVPVVPPVNEPTPAPRRRVATWAVGGAGAAVLVGSLAAQLVANGRLADLQANCPGGVCDPRTTPDAQGWIDSGRNAALASNVLLGVGVATVAAGAVLFFVEGRRPASERRVAAGEGGFAFRF